jgi:hypothetical protein
VEQSGESAGLGRAVDRARGRANALTAAQADAQLLESNTKRVHMLREAQASLTFDLPARATHVGVPGRVAPDAYVRMLSWPGQHTWGRSKPRARQRNHELGSQSRSTTPGIAGSRR